MKYTLSLPVWVWLFVCCKTQMECMTCGKRVLAENAEKEPSSALGLTKMDDRRINILGCLFDE